jgi:hypothetical protein
VRQLEDRQLVTVAELDPPLDHTGMDLPQVVVHDGCAGIGQAQPVGEVGVRSRCEATDQDEGHARVFGH